jgi:hypothetical protein
MNWRPKTNQGINETKEIFFGKKNKINKFIAKLTNRRKEKTHINKLRYEKGHQ